MWRGKTRLNYVLWFRDVVKLALTMCSDYVVGENDIKYTVVK